MTVIGTRVARLEDRLGGLSWNEARIRGLSDEQLEAEIEGLDARMQQEFERRGLETASWDEWERIAMLGECERLESEGLPLVVANIDLKQLAADLRRSSGAA